MRDVASRITNRIQLTTEIPQLLSLEMPTSYRQLTPFANYFLRRKFVAAFPPERYSSELAGRAHAYMNIHENSFRRCLLPEHIELPKGLHVDCPKKWR